jgi:glutamine amidotransferase
MQLLATDGNEGSEDNVVSGLDLIGGRITMLKKVLSEERIPHMGWNELKQTRSHPLWENIPVSKDFYFANSYHFVPKDSAVTAGITDYCGGFVSAVGKGNIFGVQCHPEKSQKAGFQLIKNFLNWNGRDA